MVHVSMTTHWVFAVEIVWPIRTKMESATMLILALASRTHVASATVLERFTSVAVRTFPKATATARATNSTLAGFAEVMAHHVKAAPMRQLATTTQMRPLMMALVRRKTATATAVAQL